MSKKKSSPKSRKLPSVFNKEQILQLVKHVEQADIMLAILFGLFCGLRIGEIVKLRKRDIDFVRRLVHITDGKLPGKNLAGYGKDRVVPIPLKVLPLIQLWFELKNTLQGEDYLFQSLSKPGLHMTTQHLFKKYKNVLKNAGLYHVDHQNKAGSSIARYNFHSLRHTYATMLWEKSGDIYAVKQALGHNDLETTMIYTHISDKVLQRKVDSAFDTMFQAPMKQEIIVSKQDVVNKNSSDCEASNLLKLRLARGEIELPQYEKLIGVLKI